MDRLNNLETLLIKSKTKQSYLKYEYEDMENSLYSLICLYLECTAKVASRPKTERADPIDLLAVADFAGVPVGERDIRTGYIFIFTPTPPAILVLNGK